MKRKIIFKGKRVDNGEWVEGNYIFSKHSVIEDSHYILPFENVTHIKVIPGTVCQYTGLKDKNGKMIFEGDKVLVGIKKMTVIFNNGCFYTPFDNSKYRLYGWKENTITVIGNIHD